MDNRGEVSQILNCVTLNCVTKIIVPIKSYATFKSSKFATLPHDYPSLLSELIVCF